MRSDRTSRDQSCKSEDKPDEEVLNEVRSENDALGKTDKDLNLRVVVDLVKVLSKHVYCVIRRYSQQQTLNYMAFTQLYFSDIWFNSII